MTIAVVLSTSSLVVTQQVHQPGFITTVAGSGRAGHGGDNGLATEASFNNVAMVIQTKNGDLYISDPNTHVVRKVTNSSGIITTFAGRPSLSGSSGDGGLATSARLNYPWGLYYNETSGSLYIVDTQNHRVRRVDPNGKISTVAGWSAGYSGDGGLAIDAQFYTPYEIIGNSNYSLLTWATIGSERLEWTKRSQQLLEMAPMETSKREKRQRNHHWPNHSHLHSTMQENSFSSIGILLMLSSC